MPTIAYDARSLQPQTRHWGPSVMVDNILTRLSVEYRFIGLAHRFAKSPDLDITSWPLIPKAGKALFELSPLFVSSFDVYWGTNDLLPVALRGPSVLTVHDLLLWNRMDNERDGTFSFWRLRSSLRRARLIVTDSKTTADDLIDVFPHISTKVRVALLGFDTPPQEQACAVQRNGRDGSDCYVVMLGAHRPRKNLQLVLSAVQHLREAGVRVRLCITGDVHPTFQQALHEHRSFTERTGVLPKAAIFGLLQRAVALVFPSRYEGFGFPLLEAMAARCPVLALDTPINREVAGDAAWLLSEDPFQWSTAIQTLIQNPSMHEEWVLKGIENVKRFSWERTAEAYSEVFQDALR
ncbi:MAG: glycosyltransferase family 4 protein [Terriglobia bacterium]